LPLDYREIGFERNTSRDANNDFNHTNSLVVVAIDQYSASTEEPKTTVCLFVFRNIGDPPRVTKYLVKECHVKAHAP